MSVFGTFRRVKKGKQPTQYFIPETNRLQIEGQTKVGLTDSTSKLSSSTPNLHKLKPRSSPNSNQSSINITTDDDDNQSTGGDSVTSAPCELGSRPSSAMKSKSKPHVGRNGSFTFATGTLTRFVSMVAIGSTLRRSTTRRKFSHSLQQDAPSASKTENSVTYNEEDVRKQNPLSNSWICEDVDEMKDSLFVRKNEELQIQHQQELLLGKKRDLMLQGVKKFNRNCVKGMDFFVKNNLVENTPEDIANFLATHENLSKIAIGDYLGTFGEFYEKVLHCFVRNHNFKRKGLVEALRIFLASFRLPGEAQKIDRMMETFALHYCTENPGVFNHEDSCYLLSFAVIMLNTSLHNPNVKEKPTLEQFISMNRDIDNGKSLDPAFLTRCYYSIREEEFQIPQEDVSDLKLTFSNADRKGWLWKQGARFNNSWTRRWFVLSNHCLYYFKTKEDTVPRGIIPLENIETTEGNNGKYFSFILSKTCPSDAGGSIVKSCKTKSDGTIVLGSHSEYILGTENSDDRRRWIFALKQWSSFSSYYTLVQQKKKNMSALLQRRPNRDKNNASSRKATVRKSQISMPIDRPENGYLQNINFNLSLEGSSVAGSDFSSNNYSPEEEEEDLTEYDDGEFSISCSNFDEQSLTEYDSEISDIRIQIDSPISSQSQSVDVDSISASGLSTKSQVSICSDQSFVVQLQLPYVEEHIEHVEIVESTNM